VVPVTVVVEVAGTVVLPLVLVDGTVSVVLMVVVVPVVTVELKVVEVAVVVVLVVMVVVGL